MKPRARLLALALLPACSSAATYNLAVGWTGPLPTWQGACRPALAPEDAIQGAGERYRAVHPGATRIDCEKGELRLSVRAPSRLTIGPVAESPLRGKVVLTVAASDAEGGLDLGDAPVDWTLPPALRRLDACSHLSGACLAPSSVRVVAEVAGTFPVVARFGALTATVPFEVKAGTP